MNLPDGNASLWSQELQVHWPKSWRFLAAREILLEAFTPRVFTVEDNALFIRYAENQDLRVSPSGMHLRILAHGSSDAEIDLIFDQVIKVMEPLKFTDMQASFSNVKPLDREYDEARQSYARIFYSSWVNGRQLKDFALVWDEGGIEDDAKAHYEVGVVNEEELLDRVADAAGMSDQTLRRRTPAWMKVRSPRVAIFMHSDYTSEQASSGDVGQLHIPLTWRKWRNRSIDLFDELTKLEATAERGGKL